MSKKRSSQESVRSVQWVSMEKSIVGKDLRNRCVLSLEWKREEVIDGEWLSFYVVSKYRQYVILFRHKARVWQTAGQNYNSKTALA